MKFLEFAGHNPALNLALEETLLAHLQPEHEGYFILWQNSPAVIIGRHQIASEVVNLDYARQNQIPIIRRISGGGAVYHDLGNLNFSFLINFTKKPQFLHLLKPVCRALEGLGIAASTSARNDIAVAGKKISGCSQYTRSGKLLQHGTLLVNLDTGKMASVLRHDPQKLGRHGVASMPGRIANLQSLSKGKITIPVLKEALRRHCANDRAVLPSWLMDEATSLAKTRYENSDWNYGVAPNYNFEKRKRFAWGEIVIRLNLKQDIIQKCLIHGDFFSNEPIAELEKKFEGKNFRPEIMAKIADCANMEACFSGCDPAVMREFFTRTIFI